MVSGELLKKVKKYDIIKLLKIEQRQKAILLRRQDNLWKIKKSIQILLNKFAKRF